MELKPRPKRAAPLRPILVNMFWISLLSSFLLVALGQPARIPLLGVAAAALGFALFWRAMLMLQTPRARFCLAMGWFAVVQMVHLSWMSTIQYMGPLIVLVYLFLTLALGVQFGALSLLLRPGKKIGTLQALAMGAIWVLFEWSRLFPCTGFTWNPIGLFLSCSNYSLQFASVFGLYGLSFWIILTNVTALSALQTPFSKSRWGAFSLIALFPYLFGLGQSAYVERLESKPFRALLVQTALMPEEKDFYSEQARSFVPAIQQWERILEAITKEGHKPTDLIVLPEAALPYGAFKARYPLSLVEKIWSRYFGSRSRDDFPPLQEPFAQKRGDVWRVSNAFWLQALANHYGAEVISGLDDENYNAAFFFQPHDPFPQRYEKRILVPVAEYIPFSFWSPLADFVAYQFGISQSFTPGQGAKLFQGKTPLAVSICYEETFGQLIRDSRLLGAELFVNISNDSWFPSSKLPQQHFHHGKIRAVENGVFVLRTCNTGITAGIDSLGRTIGQLEPNEEEAEVLSLTLPLSSHRTLYVLWGDWAILTLSGLFIGLFCLRKFNAKTQRKKLLLNNDL